MEKLNIAELLKDCPKGMELDCTCADNVVFDKIIEYDQIKCLIGESRDPLILDKYGRLLHICCPKCVIFPKGKTTWEGFVPPCKFKTGDVLYIDCANKESDGDVYKYIFILKEIDSLDNYFSYCYLSIDGFFPGSHYLSDNRYTPRLATEEEKQKLFDAIKENGYKWNPETKTLEKLIEPKFKVGDRIKEKKAYISGIITDISDGTYKVEFEGGGVAYANIAFQDEWELVPNKFDIATLKPFDKVLTRVTTGDVWCNDLFGYYKDRWFHCGGHIATHYCIPYKGNEHLLGTTNDCDEYYKTWE